MNDKQNKHALFNGWNLLLLFALFWTGMEVPLSYFVYQKGMHQALLLDIILSLFFAFNIYLYHRYEFSIKKVKQDFEVTNHSVTFSKLILIIDIISLLPVELIIFYMPENEFIHHLRLIRLLRLLNIFDFLRAKDYLTKSFQVLLFLFGIIVSINFFTCIWMKIQPSNNLHFIDEYIRALYWTITTITTVGYGDITPSTNIARLYSIFIMLLGISSFALIIGSLSRLLVRKDRYAEEKRNKINSMQNLLAYYHIPADLKRQIFHFYHHILDKKVGHEDSALLKELPTSLQNEVQLYMKIKLMKGIKVFKNANDECLKLLAQNLEEKFFSPGQTIVKAGDEGSEMYLISHGEVDIKREGQLIAHLKAGAVFGEMALIENMKRSADISCSTYCDIFILKKSCFEEVTARFPSLKQSFMEIYQERKGDKV